MNKAQLELIKNIYFYEHVMKSPSQGEFEPHAEHQKEKNVIKKEVEVKAKEESIDELW